VVRQGVRSARFGGWRFAGVAVALVLAFALVLEAAPPPQGDGDEVSFVSPREEPPCLALSNGGAPRGSVPTPLETRVGALLRRPISEEDASNRMRALGERAPPRIPSGHRKQPERRARTSTTDDAH
jgi:hypothetical protein